MTVTGRVLDPSGKPVPDAAVMVIVRSKYCQAAAVGVVGGRRDDRP